MSVVRHDYHQLGKFNGLPNHPQQLTSRIFGIGAALFCVTQLPMMSQPLIALDGRSSELLAVMM